MVIAQIHAKLRKAVEKALSFSKLLPKSHAPFLLRPMLVSQAERHRSLRRNFINFSLHWKEWVKTCPNAPVSLLWLNHAVMWSAIACQFHENDPNVFCPFWPHSQSVFTVLMPAKIIDGWKSNNSFGLSKQLFGHKASFSQQFFSKKLRWMYPMVCTESSMISPFIVNTFWKYHGWQGVGPRLRRIEIWYLFIRYFYALSFR